MTVAPAPIVGQGWPDKAKEHSMGKKLFVGNLPFSTTSEDLNTLFAQAGAIRSATVMMDRVTGRSRGFGFVEMSSDEEAEKAISQFNGYDLRGRSLNVNEARERIPGAPRSGPPPGGYSRDSGGGRGSDRDFGGGGFGGGGFNDFGGGGGFGGGGFNDFGGGGGGGFDDRGGGGGGGGRAQKPRKEGGSRRGLRARKRSL
jgi:RNA recognition motif-containing protein